MRFQLALAMLTFVKSVFQCLYSQCDTAHFGFALHHIIAQCYGTGNEITFAFPPMPNRDSLRRREAEYAAGAKLYGSGSASGYPTQSADYPTQSANYPSQSVGGRYPPSPTASPPHLETAASPALSPAIPTTPSHSALAETTMESPVLFTGSSKTMLVPGWFILLSILLVILLT